MSIALSEFWTRLVRSGITDAEGCKQVAKAFTNANSGTPPNDARSVARFMIKRGNLTRFQARAIIATPPRELRAGSYLIRSDKTPPPLSQWVEASRVDDGRCGLLLHVRLPLAPEGLVDSLAKHQRVQCDSVQPFEAEFHSSSVLIFSSLPPGCCLSDTLADGGALPPREVCRIGVAIAKALESIHAASLVHGCIRSDRVWAADDKTIMLLRDPCASFGAPALSQKQWLDQLESRVFYAAPELPADGRAATAATDIYALGCVLFRLATGRFPYVGEDDTQTLAAHQNEMPAELSNAVNRGEAGDPLFRVIAFAMAKSSEARFASALQLSNALQATLDLISPSHETDVPQATRESRSARGDGSGTSAHTVDSQRAQTVSRSAIKSRDPSIEATRTRSLPAEQRTRVDSEPKIKLVAKGTEASDQVTVATKGITAESRNLEPPRESNQPTPGAPPSRKRRKKKSKAPLVLGGLLCVAVLMLIIGLIGAGPRDPERRERTQRPRVIPPVASQPPSPSAAVPENQLLGGSQRYAGYELVADERLLFVPPYAADSAPPKLDLLPPGPAVIASVRLSIVVDDSNGKILINGFSPELGGIVQTACDRCKQSAKSIERLTVSLHPGREGWPEVSLMVELSDPISQDDLKAKLQVGAARTPDGATIYVGEQDDSDAFYWRASDDDSVSSYAVGSISRISEVAAVEGGAIPLPRSAQALWNGASAESDLVVLFTPNFLFADGRELIARTAPELIRPLRRVMQPDVATSLVTVNLRDKDRVFIEARFAPSGGISEAALMHKISDAVDSWPAWADQFILDSVPEPSWRLLANRLPTMMQFVISHARFGVSDGAVVANAYLPSKAFPQVALATVLAMNTPSQGAASPMVAGESVSLTVEEMLDRRMSVSFDQESLEFALEAIVNAFKQTLPEGTPMPEARILGGDLQLMGITQNQQVRDFAKSDQPLRAVLTDLVLGANPDKSATGPGDLKQALIWVVADDTKNPEQKVILITTRQAAENKYDIPREFQIATAEQ